MSIASEIQRITGNVADAYTAASGKGATMPATQNSDNLASTINTISTGITPTGTINITTNGTHDVTNYASADVQVPTTAPAHYIEKSVDANGKLINGSSIINMSGVTKVGAYCLAYAYYKSTLSSTNIDFSSITKIDEDSACMNTFELCQGITSVDLSNLTVISGNKGCQMMFFGSSLQSFNLSSLVTMRTAANSVCSSMFNGTQVTNGFFNSLKEISGNSTCYRMFASTPLTTLSFPALKSVIVSSLDTMLYGVTGCTVHFPSNLSGSGITASRLGGTNTVVLFDLPATVTLTGANSTQYERNPKYDTATALAWRVLDGGTASDPIIDWTPFYTSTTADPVVGDTIYSDSACTTAVATISSIA